MRLLDTVNNQIALSLGSGVDLKRIGSIGSGETLQGSPFSYGQFRINLPVKRLSHSLPSFFIYEAWRAE
jgi:hypothetical protein